MEMNKNKAVGGVMQPRGAANMGTEGKARNQKLADKRKSLAKKKAASVGGPGRAYSPKR